MNIAQFKLPDVGEGLTEADILTWKVAAGDAVKVNQVIVEIETAKPVVELPCPTAGSVAALLAPEGATVEVGTPIIDIVAEDAGVNLAALTGTGAAGEVTRKDLAQHLVGTGGLPEVAPTTSPGAPEGDETWTIPLKGVRRATAQAMVASAFTAPHVTEFLDVDVTRTMELVARSRGAEGYARVNPLAVLSRAMCWALHRTPELNASLQGEQISVSRRVHLGIATATDRGLMVPVVPDTHALSAGELALRIRVGDSGP
ncbi:2-oxo acid dehydrogenase subunit E2 [Kocuria sp. KRD140]|uniref:2-oxo acid dehydrogenase subunit E2 n=1 Tax=Kocuria sp. KRD140 TaxID=2729723 RepID=UPI0019D2FC95|nr:2-oxo acid dehydrogenase subunit E2 [Kocuria sp. KRD140]